MPATRKTGKPVRPSPPRAARPAGDGAEKRTRPTEGTPAPRKRDPRTDVKIAGDWLDRWLTELDEVELKVYLQIAHFYNMRTYHDASELATIFGPRTRPASKAAKGSGKV